MALGLLGHLNLQRGRSSARAVPPQGDIRSGIAHVESGEVAERHWQPGVLHGVRSPRPISVQGHKDGVEKTIPPLVHTTYCYSIGSVSSVLIWGVVSGVRVL